MKTKFLLTACLACSTAVGSASSQHADGLLVIDPDGQLVAGQYDFDSGSVLNADTRVYEGEFEGPFGNVWTIDEPGFNALSSTNSSALPAGYTTLPGSTPVTFDANAFAIGGTTSNLWHWNGAGAVGFAAVSGPTELEISKSPEVVFSSTLDGSSSGVAGFEIETTGADGFLHKHIDFTVSNTDASAPATGFYLWSLSLSVGSELQTEPIYFVHGLGLEDEEAHEAAIDFVQDTLVPEPTAAALLAGLGGLAMIRRRRSA